MISSLKHKQGQKFLFENYFSEPIAAEVEIEEEELLPLPPTFSEEELAAARSQGFVEGREAGVADAQGSIDQRMTLLLDDIVGKMGSLGDAQGRIARSTEKKMLALALAVTQKIIPPIARAQASTIVEDVIGECIPKLRDEPRIVVRVHAEMMDGLRDRIDAIASRSAFPGDIILIPDDDLTEADCKIEWSDGGAERISEAIWAEINRAIEAHLAPYTTADYDEQSPAEAETTGGTGQTEEKLNG